MCCADNSSRSLMSRPVDRQEGRKEGKGVEYVWREASEGGIGRGRHAELQTQEPKKKC